MILLDKPYVSDFLKQTLIDCRIPVVKTEQVDQFDFTGNTTFCEPATAVQQFKNGHSALLYTNSENAINWIAHNLPFTDLPEKINLFKDKAAFRDLIKPLFPNFAYQAVNIQDLDSLDIESLPMPFIIKPAIGFFSMGVYKVSTVDGWQPVIRDIRAEMERVKSLYPGEVLNTTKFIIEECIEGAEFAVDMYYNPQGKPVIVNILQHLFSSDEDVSDRVYFTTKSVVLRYKERLEQLLGEVGRLAGLQNFPIHAEVRVDAHDNILLIEINPMRFGGWCATDIVAYHAYGINPYRYYFQRKAPDWDQILAARGDQIYGLVVLDKPADVPTARIQDFDYEQVTAQFEKPLELRKINYREYPVFGFLFVETRAGNLAEFDTILHSDLKEFIRL